MPKLVLLRHGQSQWNLENRFTGWVDVDLTPAGEAEALKAGALLKEAGLQFDHAYSSVLTRAIRTGETALRVAGQLWVPLDKDWRLNERHYGALTGLDKTQTAKAHGEAQVHVWRRSYDVAPPPLGPDGPYAFSGERRYKGLDIPATESLKTTLDRVLPYWEADIAPQLAALKTILVAAHGNSLRAVVKHLFAVPEDEIVKVEIPTGNPLVIDLDEGLKPTGAVYLDAERAQPLPAI
jgi:2,3-bisphosphoglycerate-dependent phosphoglycerate mutase